MNSEVLERLDTALSQINSLNLDAALKTDLGVASIASDVRDRIATVIDRCNTARKFVENVNRLHINPLTETALQFAQLIGALTTTDAGTFIQNRTSYLGQIADRLDQIEVALLPFELAENRHRINTVLGGDAGDVNRIRAALKDEADGILKRVKDEAESVLEEARLKASDIQNTARKTASGVSVLQTGVRFVELIGTFERGLLISGIAAGAAFVVFIVYVIWLGFHQPDLKTIPEAIYTSAVRVTLLASIAAVVTFGLKIFRSNLHMYYHTLHRQQLTNSIESFVDAARTDEHRDAVLAKLIEAVSAFSTSGLVAASDDMPNSAKIIVDALPKAVGK
ncbi:hypothetical protein [Bradyrhizobium sp. CW11]|uniref:hypothetical protein n=1 Tax=Bradyrhizobium sp. CW11 TaxID=2782684 RepID=UPI001FFB3C6E|nr:hypothetical protein [Bradyrhizobium sp. CW11]MCK1345931.1 hypothetical protein [Bradyrhizobium sp. CW11]